MYFSNPIPPTSHKLLLAISVNNQIECLLKLELMGGMLEDSSSHPDLLLLILNYKVEGM